MKIMKSRNKREGQREGYWGGKWHRLGDEAARARRYKDYFDQVFNAQGGPIWSGR
jgi:hypothetical protein